MKRLNYVECAGSRNLGPRFECRHFDIVNIIAEKCGPSKEDNESSRLKQVSNYLRSAGEDDLKTSQPLISPYDSEGMLGLLSSYYVEQPQLEQEIF